MAKQAVVNPINPDVLPKLDPVFVDWYNKHLAQIPPRAPDLAALRKVFSKQSAAVAAPSPKCAKQYDEEVDGWEKHPGKIKIRFYVPQEVSSEAGWPIHLNFHGGGKTRIHVMRNHMFHLPWC